MRTVTKKIPRSTARITTLIPLKESVIRDPGKKQIERKPMVEARPLKKKGKKKRRYYSWKGGKEGFLISLRRNRPELTNQEIADRINEQWPDSRPLADKTTVCTKLFWLSEKDKSLKRETRKGKKGNYEWNDERDEYLTGLEKEKPERACKKLAELVNRQFPGERIPAKGGIVMRRLVRLGLREKQKQQGKPYNWTPEKEDFVAELLIKNPKITLRTIAEKVNKEWPGLDPPADRQKVNSRLYLMYKKRDELQEIKKIRTGNRY